ncbi:MULTISPECIES: hypothetical protein [Pseudomonadaceae]|uniref:Uncharacterized protein n=1 Tax=Pseudomonas denitrificans TaxID=43306 RepID=A0A9X7N5F1_PSEDE|nr:MULTISPECIES: hypothetical protein [Pseudomonadaceae]MBD9682563.1 hypothetical protein [Pseudomonas sp. PDM20]QEY75467.1 hypothetical protein F1C79_29720 [Pseudomonas denitrificans (nom. rej.)]
MLQPMENQRMQELRSRLEQERCVFDFRVLTLDPTATPGEAEHRLALQLLFESIQERARNWQADVIARHPQYANHEWADLTPDLARARPQALGIEEIRELNRDDGPLCRAFRDPPYGTQLQVADFREWLQALRLYPDEGLQVLDWVGDGDAEPHRSNWSCYFDDGKEWWGIWCLTLYNPRRRTLSALAASATD